MQNQIGKQISYSMLQEEAKNPFNMQNLLPKHFKKWRMKNNSLKIKLDLIIFSARRQSRKETMCSGCRQENLLQQRNQYGIPKGL